MFWSRICIFVLYLTFAADSALLFCLFFDCCRFISQVNANAQTKLTWEEHIHLKMWLSAFCLFQVIEVLELEKRRRHKGQVVYFLTDEFCPLLVSNTHLNRNRNPPVLADVRFWKTLQTYLGRLSHFNITALNVNSNIKSWRSRKHMEREKVFRQIWESIKTVNILLIVQTNDLFDTVDTTTTTTTTTKNYNNKITTTRTTTTTTKEINKFGFCFVPILISNLLGYLLSFRVPGYCLGLPVASLQPTKQPQPTTTTNKIK